MADFQISPTAQAPFPGFAYLGYVNGDGSIDQVWDLETVTWSQGDGSPTTINGVGSNNVYGAAWCFAGADPTSQQIAAYKRIKVALETVLGRSVVVRGHRDVSGLADTSCPGDLAEARIPEIQGVSV